jgi:hypothetical protein
MCFAPQAQHSPAAWGSAPRFMAAKRNTSAEGAIQFYLLDGQICPNRYTEQTKDGDQKNDSSHLCY